MGREIQRQTNGKYAVWSSVVDDYLVMGATPEEIIEMYVEDAKEEIIASVMRQVNRADDRDAIEARAITFTEM